MKEVAFELGHKGLVGAGQTLPGVGVQPQRLAVFKQ